MLACIGKRFCKRERKKEGAGVTLKICTEINWERHRCHDMAIAWITDKHVQSIFAWSRMLLLYMLY